MPEKTWTLTEVGTDTYVDELVLTHNELPRSIPGGSVTKRRLRGGLREGVDLIEVNNGTFSFAIVPTRGMGLWKARLGDLPVGWNSPIKGPVHPQFVNPMEPSGLGWLDGFDELMVRCGLESNGHPEFDEEGRVVYSLHGRIANRPAHHVTVSVDQDTGEITVTGVTDEVRFHFSKLRLTSTYKTKPGESGVRILDEVENLSATPVGIQMLYHWNFGSPILDAGATVVAPLRKIIPFNSHAAGGVDTWDSYLAPQAGNEEQVYLLDPLSDAEGNTAIMLVNAHSTAAASLHFNTRQLPCLTQWKNTCAVEDGYVTGLEPGTNFPNPRSFEAEQKRVIPLPPGGTYAMQVRLEVHGDSRAVNQARNAIAVLQEGTQPQIFREPQPGWCRI